MRHAMAIVPFVEPELSVDVPEGGQPRSFAFVDPQKFGIRMIASPTQPPDMPRPRRFMVLMTDQQIDDTSDANPLAMDCPRRERAEFIGTAVSPKTGAVMHCFEFVDVDAERDTMTRIALSRFASDRAGD